MAFFSELYPLSAHSEGSSHPVELADADQETEVLMLQALHRRTGNRRIALTVFFQKGEDFPTQLHWMPMPSVGEAALSLALYPLEQPIHRRAMHRDCAVNPRELR